MSFADKLNALPVPASTPAERLRQALDMWDEGVAMQRLVFRRRFPNASEADNQSRLRRWLARESE